MWDFLFSFRSCYWLMFLLMKVASIAAMWLQDIANYCQLIVDTVVSQWLRVTRDWRLILLCRNQKLALMERLDSMQAAIALLREKVWENVVWIILSTSHNVIFPCQNINFWSTGKLPNLSLWIWEELVPTHLMHILRTRCILEMSYDLSSRLY